MGMLSGALQGLGGGIQQAGQTYNLAKQQAIERMFREQQMALAQDAARRAQEQMEFEQTYKTLAQLPAGSPIEEALYPEGGRGLLQQFSRPVAPDAVDPTSPLKGARSLAVPVSQAPDTGADGLHPVQASEGGTIASQNLSPTNATTGRQGRVSIPFEDARARTAMLNQQAANSRAMMRMQTQMQIAQMKNALTAQIATARDETTRKGLEIRLRQVEAYEQSINNTNAYRGGMLDHYAYQDELDAWAAGEQVGRFRPGSADSEMDPMMRLRMMIEGFKQMEGGTPAPTAAPAAPKAPTGPKTPPPTPPRRGATAPAGGDAYDRWKARKGTQK
jgi:hypothetical protein